MTGSGPATSGYSSIANGKSGGTAMHAGPDSRSRPQSHYQPQDHDETHFEYLLLTQQTKGKPPSVVRKNQWLLTAWRLGTPGARHFLRRSQDAAQNVEFHLVQTTSLIETPQPRHQLTRMLGVMEVNVDQGPFQVFQKHFHLIH